MDYLGVKIENDSEGVMQDTHWASGLFGYFPSYALGNIYDGQITAAITKNLPEWQEQLAAGKLEPVNVWVLRRLAGAGFLAAVDLQDLGAKPDFGNFLFLRGDLYDPEELIKRATGTKLDSQPYLHYLTKKYSNLYGF